MLPSLGDHLVILTAISRRLSDQLDNKARARRLNAVQRSIGHSKIEIAVVMSNVGHRQSSCAEAGKSEHRRGRDELGRQPIAATLSALAEAVQHCCIQADNADGCGNNGVPFGDLAKPELPKSKEPES